MESALSLAFETQITIHDNVDGVILSASNAVHPQNVSRILARALANEANHSIYRIAFGNGGTYVDATGGVIFRTPNDGQLPDTRAWQSRLYHETYSEVVDESSGLLGTGDGTFPTGDGANTGVRSVSNGVNSQVVLTVVLNAKEPDYQLTSSLNPASISSDFIFDELGLFSPGLPPAATQGYQDVDIGRKTSTDFTYLPPATTLNFQISVNGGVAKTISITTTTNPTSWTYEQLAQQVNQALTAANAGAVMLVTKPGINTYGRLRFTSNASGTTSTVHITVPTTGTPEYANWLFSRLKDAVGQPIYVGVRTGVIGQNGGVEDKPEDTAREQERLLTHLIFSPLLKAADRVWTITYTITIVVERTIH